MEGQLYLFCHISDGESIFGQKNLVMGTSAILCRGLKILASRQMQLWVRKFGSPHFLDESYALGIFSSVFHPELALLLPD